MRYMTPEQRKKRCAGVAGPRFFDEDRVVRAAAWVLSILLAVVFLLMASVAHGREIPSGVLRYAPDVIRESQAYEGLNGYPATRIAQMWQESQGNPNAKSPVGARGLYQFMPATSKWLGEIMPDLGIADPYNPKWAIRAGIRYQVKLEKKHRACPECAKVWYGLREYNGGGLKKDLDQLESWGFDRCDYINADKANGRKRTEASIHENTGYPKAIVLKWQPFVVKRFMVRGVDCGR